MNFKIISALCLAFFVPNSSQRNLQEAQEQNHNQFGNVDDLHQNPALHADDHHDAQSLVSVARNYGNPLAESLLSQPPSEQTRIQTSNHSQEQMNRRWDEILKNQDYFGDNGIGPHEEEQKSSHSKEVHSHQQDESSSHHKEEWGSQQKNGSQVKQEEKSSHQDHEVVKLTVGQPEAPSSLINN